MANKFARIKQNKRMIIKIGRFVNSKIFVNMAVFNVNISTGFSSYEKEEESCLNVVILTMNIEYHFQRYVMIHKCFVA